jgi:hypothetical protein
MPYCEIKGELILTESLLFFVANEINVTFLMVCSFFYRDDVLALESFQIF